MNKERREGEGAQVVGSLAIEQQQEGKGLRVS